MNGWMGKTLERRITNETVNDAAASAALVNVCLAYSVLLRVSAWISSCALLTTRNP